MLKIYINSLKKKVSVYLLNENHENKNLGWASFQYDEEPIMRFHCLSSYYGP